MLQSAARSGAVIHLMNSKAAFRSAGVDFLKRYQLPPPVGEPRCLEAGSIETPKLKSYVAQFPPAAVARDQFKFATPELSTFQTGRVRKALDDAIQAALTGNKTPAEALKGAQAESERLLKPYK